MIWERLGDVDNFIEPFCGSAAVLLARPTPPRIETVNDADCYLANFWRATQHDPEQVAHYADGPVNEADLHARHRWMVLSEHAGRFRQRMRTDPDAYDCRVAGWWVWGLCCWIGSGWCEDPEAASWIREDGTPPERRPRAHSERGKLVGVHNDNHLSEQLPNLGAGRKITTGKGECKSTGGVGVHGVHRGAEGGGLSEQIPLLRANQSGFTGSGVNQELQIGTCAQRRAWLLDWFGRLRDRLRTVRVCCGDWTRVCTSESVTTRLGLTGVFLDPPYSAEAGRTESIYGVDSKTVAHDVRRWCLERGGHKLMRICLAGYAGEGHEEMEEHGWLVVEWKAHGGYGNRSEVGKANARKERLWFSPHCIETDFPLLSLEAENGQDWDHDSRETH